MHGLQYCTVYNNKATVLTIISYKGALTSAQENTIKGVVDSIKFDTEPMTAKPGKETSSFDYTDADSGLVFTVPDNWEEKGLLKDREFIDVKFASTKDSARIITYGSTDLWNETPDNKREVDRRKDFNNSIFNAFDIARMCGTSADNVSLVNYNGVEYFQFEVIASSEIYGMNVEMTMTQAVHINNGWVYMFQFAGTSESEYFSDFRSLLNSVRFPAVSGSAVSGFAVSGFADVDISSDYLIKAVTFLILIGVIFAVVIVTKVSEQGNTKSDVSVEHNKIEPIDTPTNSSASFVVCEECGKALPPDSEFCHFCGARIIKGESEL
ncbi:MAG: zinc ribbon domain-containing protein [Clostridia bacterium]|nr:zinc ribbon domain-containing protein [Clostridia bacterium]